MTEVPEWFCETRYGNFNTFMENIIELSNLNKNCEVEKYESDSVGTRLRALKNKRGYSNKQIRDHINNSLKSIGVSPKITARWVSKLSRDKVKITKDHAIALEDLTGINRFIWLWAQDLK